MERKGGRGTRRKSAGVHLCITDREFESKGRAQGDEHRERNDVNVEDDDDRVALAKGDQGVLLPRQWSLLLLAGLSASSSTMYIC